MCLSAFAAAVRARAVSAVSWSEGRPFRQSHPDHQDVGVLRPRDRRDDDGRQGDRRVFARVRRQCALRRVQPPTTAARLRTVRDSVQQSVADSRLHPLRGTKACSPRILLLLLILLLQHPFNGLFSRTTWVSRYQKGYDLMALYKSVYYYYFF